MEPAESTIKRLAKKVSDEQLDRFTDLLREQLLGSGVTPEIFDSAVRTANQQMKADNIEGVITQAVQAEENRGVDTIGRILVEFCFFRSPAVQMIWPENSEQDMAARSEFSSNVIPRPLMRYFLISVRGSIRELDGFETDSMLYADDPNAYDQLKHTVDTQLEEFKGPFGSGESAIDWAEVYEDHRFQRVTLDIVKAMRRMMQQFGTEQYVAHLEDYRTQDPENRGQNAMRRSFGRKDAHQLNEALKAAETSLQEMTH
ncbi:hypothetical protein [uncultured Pseudodesulfovibrio sp.]|uniref:hypothetical protein n=1 Tax=uncultured Pseudodesulfovibrio sp. TaxID=2035858 RepID=UPI0029C6C074|nr:hypothetical protein [uncultured Pseudodesulfovibrio sp.]